MIRCLNSGGCKNILRRPSWTHVRIREFQAIQSSLFHSTLAPRSDRIQPTQGRLLSTLQHSLLATNITPDFGIVDQLSRKDLLLESFATQTCENVRKIIELLENKQTKNGRTIRGSKRWIKMLGIERKRYDHQNGHEQNVMSVEELWEEALAEANIPFFEPPLVSHQQLEGAGSVEGDHSIAHIEAVDRESLSPILGLRLDDQGKLQETGTLEETDTSETESERFEKTIGVDAILGHQHSLNPSTDRKNKTLDATLRTVALLSAFRAEEWDTFDSSHTVAMQQGHSGLESQEMLEEVPEVTDSRTGSLNVIAELLSDMETGKYILTTAESNLLLAQMVTAVDKSVDTILNDSLHLFEQMKALRCSGRRECGPDLYTFRILVLALSRRLMASGEALKLSHELVESGLEMTPETFFNCMEICFERNDLTAATKILSAALKKNPSFRPPVEAYLWMIDMMKSQNMQAEALNLLKQTQDLNSLDVRDEGKLLSSLCHWPVRSRRGDLIDTAPLLLRILHTLEDRSKGDQKPGEYVWTTLINRLFKQTKFGSSSWTEVKRAIRTFMILYPDVVPTPVLLRQGLDAGEATMDANIVAKIIHKQLWLENKESTFDGMRNPILVGREDRIQDIPSIPQGVFRRGLQICIRAGDTESATAMLESFNCIKDSYPVKVQSDIFGLALLCYAKAGQADDAKEILFAMIETEMDPSEELHGAVLHSLVVENKRREAVELFQQMEGKMIGLTVAPGTSAYNAILLAHVKSQSWDEALSLCEQMELQHISASPQTLQSRILATYKTGGKQKLLNLLEYLLNSGEANIDERTFLLAARMLIPDAPRSIDCIRRKLREIGDTNESLKRPALDLTRSLRTAQVEQKRRSSINTPNARAKPEAGRETWSSSLSYLMTFVRLSSES